MRCSNGFPSLLQSPSFEVGLHQHQDVINIDFNLLDKFDFKNHIVADGFPFRFGFTAKFRMQVEILALIVLKVFPLRISFSVKSSKATRIFFSRKMEPKSRIKSFWAVSPVMGASSGKKASMAFTCFIFRVIFSVGFQQSDILGVLVSKKSQSVVGFLFEVAE